MDGKTPRIDKDGLEIPDHWLTHKWEKLPLGFRKSYHEGRGKHRVKQERRRAPAPRFTTAYAIAWGRSKGWKLIDRENYDYRLKRHHDLVLGADAMFETDDGIVYVQGAGKSERKDHWDRFEERGGVARAKRMHVKFVYVEFVRESADPIAEEWWA